jgi:sulfate transporter 3
MLTLFNGTSLIQSTKRPKLFWVSAGAPLASVIISTLIVFLFKAEKHGISVVSISIRIFIEENTFFFVSKLNVFFFLHLLQIGQLKCGLNRPSWDKLIFDSTYLGTVMKTGVITGIISLTVSK